MSSNRLNVSCACDFCKIRKIKCAISTTSNTKCTQCIKRNIECTFYKGVGKKRGPKQKNPKNKKREKTQNNPIHDNPMIPVDPPKGICYDDEIFCSLSIEEIRNFSNADLSLSIPLNPPREIYNMNEILCGLSTEEYFSNANPVMPIDLSKEIYNEDEIFRGLSAEDIEYFTNTYTKEELKILGSFIQQPCPFKNIVSHLCHEGCFVRYNNLN
ncbi:11966_t:CDS:1 [Dentiscutata heterogama]|uniref:11966_t:CDS:1 n=1 Tax=Dentiscutata heterogama TaxID=1316150 RepID=A0ACA9MMQ9_9GLOM|nr:11966_t:CDS:1 [Dentiscutata heterogama]